MKNRLIHTTLALTLALVLAVPGHANFAATELAPANGVLVVTPEKLEEILLSQNTDVMRQMNTVMRAKDQVNAARAELLPSISLNLVMLISNPPAFLLSSVSCLIPFLFPSKWFNLDAAKKTFSAEVTAIHLAKMNMFASAYSLLLAVAGDEAMLTMVRQQHARLEEYVNGLRVQNELGLIPQADMIRGEIDLNRTKIDLSKTAELIAQERAALRKMLGLAID
jgi:outer membrane protein TolC